MENLIYWHSSFLTKIILEFYKLQKHQRMIFDHNKYVNFFNKFDKSVYKMFQLIIVPRKITFSPSYRARERQERKQAWSYSDLTNSRSRCNFTFLLHCCHDHARGYARIQRILCTDPSHHWYAARALISSTNILYASSYLPFKYVI